jgi:hypothetical protein
MHLYAYIIGAIGIVFNGMTYFFDYKKSDELLNTVSDNDKSSSQRGVNQTRSSNFKSLSKREDIIDQHNLLDDPE